MPAKSGPKGFTQKSRPASKKGIPENFAKGGKSGNKTATQISGKRK